MTYIEPLQVIHNVIVDAEKRGITKEMIAGQMKTSVAILTRLERGNLDPTIDLLFRLADATGTRLSIRFLPQ